ncbi:MAG: sigma-70 family RNA polymerase sigma factor [Elusimicrobia bacterium]|nr:sigma-70 family RNA polymerase sigma factor [Elusimicrobiota bacterium]
MATSNSNNESKLVELAQDGNRDAFESLVRQCAERIYNLSFHLTGNPAGAEDLAQDALVNAFKNISKFRKESSFSSWVYRITLNLWKNKVRHDKKRSFLSFFSLDKPAETEDGEINMELPDYSCNPESEVEQARKSENVQKALNELDEQSKIIIVFRDMEGRNYEEISSLLECPLGTVKSRLARARESLREKLLKYFKDDKNGM